MCGIAGYIGTRELESNRVGRCLALMHRRGPDSADHYHGETADGRNVYLLFTRLSIIDLNARANQPFRVGSRVMAFNGEVYNYIELREELRRQHQVPFKTESDTEVLLQTLTVNGWQGLDEAEGMWAFAVFDESDGSLLVGRDRFGQKPLYLYRDSTGLYFGSEIKLIFEMLGHTLPVNLEQIYRYMVNGYKSLYKKNETFFEGIEELKPGHVLIVSPSAEETRQPYWLPHIARREEMTYQEAVEGARERLLRSVKLRLRADVPLAFLLSGGIDSNTLIGIARRAFDYDVHSFTIMNTDARYEERDMVDCAVDELNLRHTPVRLDTDDFLPRLRTLIRYHDAPIYSISLYAQWLLMEQIGAHGYRISISGVAADESFSGYYDHHNLYLHAIHQDSTRFQQALADWQAHVKPIVRNPYLQDPEVFIKNPGERGHVYLNAAEFAEYLKADWFEGHTEGRYTDDLMRNRMLVEAFEEAVPPLLHDEDLNAMYYSIENRAPFLDRQLFEFCNSIPTRHLVRDGYRKVVLRDAARGFVPEPILDNHRKVGFNMPIYSFLDVHDPAVRAQLLDAGSPIFDYVKRDRIEALIGKEQLPNSESKFLFYFLNSKLFLEEFQP